MQYIKTFESFIAEAELKRIMSDEEYAKVQDSDKYKEAYAEYMDGIQRPSKKDKDRAHHAALAVCGYKM